MFKTYSVFWGECKLVNSTWLFLNQLKTIGSDHLWISTLHSKLCQRGRNAQLLVDATNTRRGLRVFSFFSSLLTHFSLFLTNFFSFLLFCSFLFTLLPIFLTTYCHILFLLLNVVLVAVFSKSRCPWLCMLSPPNEIYFEASHWPSDHMISSEPLIFQFSQWNLIGSLSLALRSHDH